MLTAIAILQMVEEGTLALDDAVNDLVDPLSNVRSDETLRALLQHRSRLGLFLGSALQSVQQHPDSVFDTRQTLVTHLESPNCNPGRGYDYNDSNFQVAGLVAETLTGMDGTSLFESRIFGPADTDYAVLAPAQPDPERINGTWLKAARLMSATSTQRPSSAPRATRPEPSARPETCSRCSSRSTPKPISTVRRLNS